MEEGVGPEDRREVLLRFTPREDEVGWPGLLHGGLHYFALHEISYWGALTLTGKVHRFDGQAAFDQDRLPRVGVEHTARAWVAERAGPVLTMLAETTTASGRRCGRVRSRWVPARRSEVERARLELPDSLLEEMDP